MPTTLSTRAIEKSTYIITAAFADADGDAVIPTTITWKLTTDSGTVINSRTGVSVAVPAASNDIVLSGLDLAVQTGETGDVRRILTVEAVYSADEGASLPLKDEATFIVINLSNIT